MFAPLAQQGNFSGYAYIYPGARECRAALQLGPEAEISLTGRPACASDTEAPLFRAAALTKSVHVIMAYYLPTTTSDRKTHFVPFNTGRPS